MRGGTNRTLWHFVTGKESIFIEPFRWKFDRNFPRPSKNPLRASASMIPDGTKVEGETRNGTRPRFLSFLFRIEACRSWSQSSGLAMRSHRRKRSLSDSSPSDTIDEASRSLSKGIPFQNFERGDERRIARLEAFPSPFLSCEFVYRRTRIPSISSWYTSCWWNMEGSFRGKEFLFLFFFFFVRKR